MDEALWKEMLGVLKDISGYLEKQDAVQERADVDKPPKAQETPKPIKGAQSPPNAPSTAVAKEYGPDGDKGAPARETSGQPDLESGATDGQPFNKAEDECDDEKKHPFEKKDDEDEEELKSLLKSISGALDTISKQQAAVPALIKSEISKAMPTQMDRMLRKMGFQPTHPDVMRLGLDSTSEVKKSEDSGVKGDIAKSEDAQIEDAVNALNITTNLDWRRLGQLREKLGLFEPFQR